MEGWQWKVFYIEQNLCFYAAPGIGILGLINSRMIQDSTYKNATSPEIETKENDAAFKLNITGGLVFNKKYIIWAEYNFPAATITDQYYTGYHTSIQAGLGFIF